MDRSPKVPLDENAKLMQKAANGDIKAFDRLFQRFAPLLMHLFVRRGVDLNSADDLAQKIFIHLWRQRKNYRPESSFETYLFSIARNILNKEIRRSCKITKIRSKKQPDSDKGTYNALSQPEAEFYLKELTDALESAKAKLTAKQQKALQASQQSDTNFHEVLKELGCSKGVYKNRLKRARKRLRELLAPFFTGEGKRRKS
jgi:RNA polymerase sigma-70 factor (ECF subfamily)